MTPFTAPLGGVMTDEAGAITGDLELVDIANERAHVRYVGATDVYTVTGNVPQDWDEAKVTAHLTTDPGNDEWGNPASTSLASTNVKNAQAAQPESGSTSPLEQGA